MKDHGEEALDPGDCWWDEAGDGARDEEDDPMFYLVPKSDRNGAARRARKERKAKEAKRHGRK